MDAFEWFSFCQFCDVGKVLIIQKKKKDKWNLSLKSIDLEKEIGDLGPYLP
jgi:hypothetical protein